MEFSQYMDKNILAWLSYNESYEDPYGRVNKVCYVYPRYLIKDGKYEPINSNDFPSYGRIEAFIKEDESAEDVCNRFGSLVNVLINEESYPNYEAKTVYKLNYNPRLGRNLSPIWLESFTGKGFYQVVDVNSSISVLKNDSTIPEPDCSIYTTAILLRYDHRLYGPFEYDTKEGITTLRGMKEYQYTVGEYGVSDYNGKLIGINDNNNSEAVVLVARDSITSPQEAKTKFDWISQETLVASFIDTLRFENNYTRDQVRKLKDMASKLIESADDVHFTEERVSRIKALLDSASHKEECAQAIIQFALTNEDTKEILVNELATKHFDQVQAEVSEYPAVRERVEELKLQEASLRKQIQELKVAAEKTVHVSSEEDQKKISDLERAIDELRKEKAELISKTDIQKDIDSLKAEREALISARNRAKESYNEQLLDNNELEKQFSSTLEAFNDRAKQTARILDSKILEKILRGVGEEPAEALTPFDVSLLHGDPMDASAIIKRVQEFLTDKAHRDVSTNDVANYLICLSQGFITTFAGEPGTGKTSLCNLLAKALGLAANDKQKRFIEISVERGWTSHKDFIGYYNPLTKSMVRSNAEVYNAFETMSNECEGDKDKLAPFIMLLDEANLSPIEHYWASFLRNCDYSTVSNRTIALGGDNSFNLPEHLRFLATVNFDHTTEELSPRFLDRSWVIMLEPSRIDDEADDYIDNAEDMISFGAIRKAFCVEDASEIDEAIQNKWVAIQKIFRDRSLQIMPRNLKMVRNYCAVACKCMERDAPSTKLAPLDYAFSQKILPTINGTGENYQCLIDDLLKECTAQNMPISAKHLDRMKRVAANNMGFFQFFAY